MVVRQINPGKFGACNLTIIVEQEPQWVFMKRQTSFFLIEKNLILVLGLTWSVRLTNFEH